MNNSGPIIREEVTKEKLYTFQPSFRIEGVPKNRDVPSITVEGRDGEVVHPDLIREEARSISVVGELYATGGDSISERKKAVDEELDKIMLPIGKNEEVWLSRGVDDERFIPCRYTGVDHDYVERVARTLATCRFEFVAYDPFWYNLESVFYTEEVDFNSGEPITLIELESESSTEIHPIIWIEPKDSGKIGDDTVASSTATSIIVSGDLTGTIPAGTYSEPYGYKIVFTSGAADGESFYVVECSYDSGVNETTLDLLDYSDDAAATDTFDIYETFPVKNPELYNYSTGRSFKWTGELGEHEILVIDTYKKKVKLINSQQAEPNEHFFLKSTYPTTDAIEGENVLSQVNSQFLVYGFDLTPGLNRIEAVDENENMVFSIRYRERWL